MSRRPRLRAIPGTSYRASADGRIWSRYRSPSASWRPVRGYRTRAGYIVVILQVDGRPWKLLAHRLVLAAFRGWKPGAVSAMGVDPQTARIYVDAMKAFDRSEILRRAAELLRPQT